jgi:hypothetical protein
MAHADPTESGRAPTAPSTPVSPTRRPLWIRGLALLAMLALLSFVAIEGRSLYGEWAKLQGELGHTRAAAVIGYPGIHPNPSLAQRPANWFHQEGEHLLLWGGWRPGSGHTWFRVNPGDVDQAHISLPRGRDVQRAIDRPLVETGGGTIWARVPDEAPVAGGRLGGVDTAYPLLILDKVAVVNDLIADQPFLVLYNPFASPGQQVSVFEPIVDGHRVTMGQSGYMQDTLPVLYDRGTESLWIPDATSLKAVAGPHKGTALKLVAHPSPLPWSRWRSEHPQSRLVVGADRDAPRPEL